jgi:SAM-dependent methyltransferase
MPLDRGGSQTLVSRAPVGCNWSRGDKVSGDHSIRMSFAFDPAVDVPAGIYLSQLWLYSLTVLYPVQAVRRVGMYPKTSLGRYPARRPTQGEGKFYCREFSEPVYLEHDSPQSESVREFDRGAKLYETVVVPFTRPVHEESLVLIQRMLPPAARILDLGCGPGTELFRLAEAVPDGEVVGIDLSAEMIAAAHEAGRQRGLQNTAFFQADVTHLPDHFTGRFDAIHSSFAFHHYSDPTAALSEAYRALNSGGKAFVIDGGTWWANMLSAPLAKMGDPGWVGFHTPEEFRALFLGAGFTDFYWEELLPGIGMCVGSK